MDADTLHFVRDLVRRRSAIVLDHGKEYLIEARLGPVARDEGYDSIGALVGALKTMPFGDLHGKVIEAMTTNETSFFRDVHPFEALRQIVLPEVLAKRRTSRRLNIWCGASSTGQEPYTIAMVLREYFPELVDWQVKIIATDLSIAVLERAREGRYRQLEVNRGLPAHFLLRYFDRIGPEWQVKPAVRELVEFCPLNLIEPWPTMPEVAVVFLRNVLIYFDVETKRHILAGVRKVLAPDGVLFLGGAETTMNIDPKFDRIEATKSSCYRVRGESRGA
ncbi:MAG: protein-glutamate O-methyltransferase CheR [Polyangiaceae bacterium]|nr:protein-glutamate O-methyltransferase CheR [Polyangiaceae bacterium]